MSKMLNDSDFEDWIIKNGWYFKILKSDPDQGIIVANFSIYKEHYEILFNGNEMFELRKIFKESFFNEKSKLINSTCEGKKLIDDFLGKYVRLMTFL